MFIERLFAYDGLCAKSMTLAVNSNKKWLLFTAIINK